ncbi:MAG: hypothetical protein KBS95_00880 [Alistipes sp.]|nr:hypothetical protein [Candidatus Alistipes equi]
MRLLFSVIFSFASICICFAQDAETSSGMELPRTLLNPRSSFSSPSSKYIVRLSMTKNGANQASGSFVRSVEHLNRQVLLRVKPINTPYEVLLNEKPIGRNMCGVLPAEFNITKSVKDGKNVVSIIPLPTHPSNEIYRESISKPTEAEIHFVPTMRIRDIFSTTRLNDSKDAVVSFGIIMKSEALNQKIASLTYTLKCGDRVLHKGTDDMMLSMRAEDTVRFSTIVPREYLWNVSSTNILTLEVESKLEMRPAEYVVYRTGIHETKIVASKLYFNGEPCEIHAADYDRNKPLDEHLKDGRNAIVLRMGIDTEAVLTECDNKGVFVVLTSPINTYSFSSSIKLGGNPSNDLFWLGTYLERNERMYRIFRSHPCIVAYNLASGSTNGICVYESYLLMKNMEQYVPIIYESAVREWASDDISIR